MKPRMLFGIGCLTSLGAAAVTPEEAALNVVTMATSYMEHCILVDQQLRVTCSRIGPHLSDKNKPNCLLPSTSFEARTARDYDAFKQANRDVIRNNQDKIDKALQTARRAFEGRFAEVRAGRISMLDLESMNHEVTDRCTTAQELLRARPQKK